MPDNIKVEVVFALPGDQVLISKTVEAGATVADVICDSGLHERFADEALDELEVGIWGRPVSRSFPVKDGDRVELYRPLTRDPREARRELAQSGMTMSESQDA